MRLTVIVPVLNEQRRIPLCLDALNGQTGIAERIVVERDPAS